MTISRKMLEIIRQECQNITTDGDARYDDYKDDLFELIADVASLEAAHLQARTSIVPKIKRKIDAAAEILLDNDSFWNVQVTL